MRVQCPKCRGDIATSDVNVAKDTAFCRACNEAFCLSDIVSGEDLEAVDLRHPPSGCSMEPVANGFVVSATTRHPIALFLVPFMCVWSGFSLGGLYGSQIISGHFNLVASLFGVPFVAGTVLFGSMAVMSVCGRVRVTVRGDQGEVFTGVGPVGWCRRFNWSAVRRVEERAPNFRAPQSKMAIALEGDQRLTFGSMLTDARRYFVVSVLLQALAARR